MNDAVNEIANMIYEDGNNCDFGWRDEANQTVIDKAKSLSNKPYCTVRDWVWWDLECSEDSKNALAKQRLQPCLIYGRHVITDELGRYRPSDQMRSGMLTQFHSPAFFETKNTMYILIGKGTRKTVTPNHAASIFF